MVQNTKLKELLIELRRGFEIIYGPRLRGVFLFGSYARGEQEEGSDVDVLVVIDRFTGSYGDEVRRTGRLGSELSLKYGSTISQVFVKESDWLSGQTPFLDNVRQEAIAA